MGRGLADMAGREQLLPPGRKAPGGMVGIATVAGARKSPVEVSAEILATLRHRAEDSFNGRSVRRRHHRAAYFDDAQRQATKDAARWPA